MKKLLLIAVLFIGCKKENKDQITITVLESGTTIPVSGANLILLRDNYPVSSFPTFFFKGVTDENGTVQMDAEKFNSGTIFQIEKDKYWKTVARRKKTTLYVTPEGWLKLRLHPLRTYGPNVSLRLEIRTQDDSQGDGGINGSFATDKDTTVLLRGFGGLPNKIVWNLFYDNPDLNTTGTINNLLVPRFDTLRNNILEY